MSEKKLIEVRNCEFISFDKINLKVDASAFYPGLEQYYNDGHYPFIRVADVDNFIDYNNCINTGANCRNWRIFNFKKSP